MSQSEIFKEKQVYKSATKNKNLNEENSIPECEAGIIKTMIVIQKNDCSFLMIRRRLKKSWKETLENQILMF